MRLIHRVLAASAMTVTAASFGLLGASDMSTASTAVAGTSGTATTSTCVGSPARVKAGAAAQEPKLFQDSEANAYGVVKPSPLLPAGSVHIPTIFHVISDYPLSAAEKLRYETMISAQLQVLNDSYAGRTAPDASDTPFRFDLAGIDYTVNAAWYTVTPGKTEREMKQALYQGDSTTLNVYTANIGDGLLGWSYFPKAYNNGRGYLDGVVMLDESMPGGTVAPYNQGDTLTHEVGHWLMLYHTFQGACGAAGDFVTDTPKEAVPQFGCPEGADTCAAPGLDPVHNFMDYSVDSCMNMFTAGQAKRMNDAWIAFRASRA